MSTKHPEGSYIEVYRCANVMEADRAAVEVLGPSGIAAVRRDRVSHAIPAPSSEAGAYFLAVPEKEAAHARKLIQRALTDGILDGNEGQLMP